MFSHRFRMMAQEGHLASSSLLAGLEGLAKSDHYQPGTIYSVLFNLSIGLERMMKIAVVTHHMSTHNLEAPTDQTLRSFGHSLLELYKFLKGLGEGYGVESGWYDEKSMHYDVLVILSEFALSSRYHNLDRIVEGRSSSDPLSSWFDIHLRIAEETISYRRRSAINERAIAHCDRNNIHGFAMGMRGEYELMVNIVYQLEVTKLSRGYLVWTILEVMKPIYRLLCSFCSDAHAIETAKGLREPIVPHLDELFPYGLTTKSDAIRRKAWTTLFYMGGRY